MSRSTSRNQLKTARWRDIRQQQLQYQPECVECVKDRTATPTGKGEVHIDHIDPKLVHPDCLIEGPWEGYWEPGKGYSNLQTLCRFHHGLKTAADEGKKVKPRINADGTPEGWE